MKSKYIAACCAALSLALVSTSAHAWFFVFIPGALVGKISDAITGSEGENCVGAQAKVGDNVRVIGGGLARVQSLSGESSRCKNPEFPVRAMLGPVDRDALPAGIDLPDGWVPVQLTEAQKARGLFFYAKNETLGTSMVLSGVPRKNVTDLQAFVAGRRDAQVANLQQAHGSGIEQLDVQGMPAWRFEVAGVSPSSGVPVTYQGTIVDADVRGRGQTLIYVNSWAPTAAYPQNKATLEALPAALAGVNAKRLNQ